MAQMDAHMQAMRSMHDRIVGARTPEQRQALMAEHLRLMQDGMAMMGGMGPGAGLGMGMMSGDKGAGSMPAGPMTPEMRQQMLEKRMEMMQSMMQMMMDRMPAPAPASK
jgi:hypothetical protein